jgi:O-methyltransferase
MAGWAGRPGDPFTVSVLTKLRARLSGADLRARYLDLLANALTHTLYDPIDRREMPNYVKQAYRAAFEEAGIRFGLPTPHEERQVGRDRPVYAQTMIGVQRLRSLRQCAEIAVRENVPGDMIEAGTWRGGAAIMMRGILEAYGDRERRVVVADSFQGLPEPDPERYPADSGDLNFTADELAIPLQEVRENFARYNLLDDRVEFLEGWFRDTLPALSGRRWAVIRLDGDLYESTMDGLVNLYPQLSPGGFLIVDDFGFPNCREAIEDYRRDNGIEEEITDVDWTGAFWRKTG